MLFFFTYWNGSYGNVSGDISIAAFKSYSGEQLY